MKKLDYITILRALAILMVLVVHVREQTTGIEKIHPYVLSMLNNGARGVQLFYMLSAFTLFLSFHKRIETEINPFRNYAIRRFFRIAPLYYIAIVYYLWQDGFGARYWLGDATHISTYNIIANFTFTHGFNPYWITSIVPGGWSVAIEMLFYCILPFLFLKIKNIQQAYNLILVALILRTILLIFFRHFILISDQRLWNEYLFLYLPNQLPVFALGILLYFFLFDKDNLKLSPLSLVAGSLILITGLIVQPDLLLSGLFEYGIAFFLLVLGLHRYHPRIIFNGCFKYIGNISYTLYLTHWAAIHVLTKLDFFNPLKTVHWPSLYGNYILNYVMVLLVSVLFSTPLYYGIELPAQKWGKRLIRKQAI